MTANPPRDSPPSPLLAPAAWPWYLGAVSLALVVGILRSVSELDPATIRGTAAADILRQSLPRFVILGITTLLTVRSGRTLWARTAGRGKVQLWRIGVLGFGGFMWLSVSVMQGVRACGGWSLNLLTCRDFAVETLVTFCAVGFLHLWGGYVFGVALLGTQGGGADAES